MVLTPTLPMAVSSAAVTPPITSHYNVSHLNLSRTNGLPAHQCNAKIQPLATSLLQLPALAPSVPTLAITPKIFLPLLPPSPLVLQQKDQEDQEDQEHPGSACETGVGIIF